MPAVPTLPLARMLALAVVALATAALTAAPALGEPLIPDPQPHELAGVHTEEVCPPDRVETCSIAQPIRPDGVPVSDALSPVAGTFTPANFHAAYGVPTSAAAPVPTVGIVMRRRPHRRVRPRDVLDAVRAAAVHDRERLLSQGQRHRPGGQLSLLGPQRGG